MPRNLKEVPPEPSENELDGDWQGRELLQVYSTRARRTERWMVAASILMVVVGILVLILTIMD
jgi:hypothetical protein